MVKKFFSTIVKRSIDVTYDFSNDIHSFSDTQWQRVDIIPIIRRSCGVIVNLNYYLETGNYVNNAAVSYGLGDDSVTKPTWVLIARANDMSGETITGTEAIIVPKGKYLFITNTVVAGDSYAICNLTLQNGQIITPCTGSAIASGSPLTWDRLAGMPT